MYKKILVPLALDHSRDTRAAFDIARGLAADGAAITALTVVEDVPAHVRSYLPEDHGSALRSESEAALSAELGGVKDVTPVVVSGHPGRTIVDYARDHSYDCIVIASHQPGLQDYFIGSTANRVVRHAPCSVHVVR